MKNAGVGKIGAAITGLSILAFAASMIAALYTDAIFACCLSGMFIAIGFIPFMAAINVCNAEKQSACAVSAMCFAVVYAVLIFLVYYAECTTVRMDTDLSGEALSIISYGHLGSLFFNYDLLGYAFMALSTFLTGLNFRAADRCGRILKRLLMIHGVFFISCLLVPMFPVFTEGTNNLIGTLLLEIWCLYFLPICILGCKYFAEQV